MIKIIDVVRENGKPISVTTDVNGLEIKFVMHNDKVTEVSRRTNSQIWDNNGISKKLYAEMIMQVAAIFSNNK